MKSYIHGLHHVGIPTKNIEKTIKFYKSFGAVIAFEKMDEDNGQPIRVVLMKFCNIFIELYERLEIPELTGAIDHLAFEVENIDTLFEIARKQGYTFMEDCKDGVQLSTYWPKGTRWFIVIGVNGEKIEFCQEVV
jgi:catechol 2,3-dioxygenase-like lactoylglutathione lyase family enzyme